MLCVIHLGDVAAEPRTVEARVVAVGLPGDEEARDAGQALTDGLTVEGEAGLGGTETP